MNATFDWIAENIRDQIDFVVWTGDSARHDSDETIPRNAEQVLGTNTWIANKFVELLDDPKGNGMTVPVIPTFGNNDILPHNILLPGPNKWLQYYTHIWRRFIPEAQRHSFEFGGWFYVEAIPNKLAVFSLNTLYFFDRNAGVDGCESPSEPGYKQLEWLRIQLQFMRERGMKAILMGHVPPARTESKKLWDEACWQQYTLWLKQYRDVVVSGLYGHMNIDHFLIQDTKDIELAVLSGEEIVSTRTAMDDELTVQSAADYLQELREDWSKLDPPPISAGKGKSGKGVKGGRKKGKKKKDPWGERYQLSFINPSIVPTYYPSLRVYEYNISGLETHPVWQDAIGNLQLPKDDPDQEQKHIDLRRSIVTEAEPEIGPTFVVDQKNKHGKKGKKGPKKPKDPSLVIPDPPAKSSPPGPAYSPQPLSLTGYTQYFANLTHINNVTTFNDSSEDETESLWSLDWLIPQRWRKGRNGNREPKQPRPEPREFQFEVEYSTFDDKVYKLADLTVNSYVDLAYRIGQKVKKGKNKAIAEVAGKAEEENDWDVDEEEEDDHDEDTCDDETDDEEVREKADKKKKKKKKGKKKQNKTWVHFLTHAFVSTVEKDELIKKYA